MNMQELIDALQLIAKMKAVGTPPNAQYLHGRGGLLSTPGLDPNIISAMVMPQGLASTIPVRLSNQTDMIVGILTGLTASSGSEPTAACADFPQAGNFKLCMQTLPFGRIGRETQILQVDRVGEVTNRGEFLDHTVINNPFARTEAIPPFDARNFLRDEAQRALAALVAAIGRDYARIFYTGSPVNTAGSAGYIEYNGLDRLINTGYRDAVTGQLCPAADSWIASFGDANVATDASNTVRQITEILNSRRYLAQQLNINVSWRLVMRYALFRALTEIWPCAYLTSRCTLPSGNTSFMDAGEQVRMRDDMRNNHYLLVDGERVEVVIDDAIAQTDPAAGVHESAIYFVPNGTVGGVPLLYWDFYDMRGANPAIEALTPQGSFQVLGGGRYLLHRKPPTNECIQARMIARPRLILRAPFLAARLTDVRYTTYINERSPFPADPAFYNGGNTTYPAPSFYPFI